MKKFALVTLASLLFSAFTSQAGINEDSTKSGKLTVSGYVDVYYQYNLNNPSVDPGLTFSENPGRIFDIKNNQFSLGLAQTKFAYTTEKSEVVVDLTYGPNSILGNFGNVAGGNDLMIKQAYMSYMFTKKLNVTIGQFGTHIGYELIDAPLNYNYSLSYLFGNGPFYHTGAKASYAITETFGIMAGVVNGWDEMFDFNGTKSAIAQIYVAPTDGFNIYVNYIGGDERNGYSFPTLGTPGAKIATTAKTVSHLFDLTTTYQLTDAFKLGLNAAYGFGNNLKLNAAEADGYSKGSWGGAALYADYRFSDFFGLGLRAEHFIDKDGLRYISSTFGQGCEVSEFTLTGDLKFMDGHFNLKPEFRIDVAKVNDNAGGTAKGFTSNPGDPSKAKTTNLQPTIGMAAIYAF
ncbi:porin [uncultured Cytophaga sp.]|uniref:porin n=1 Tax=uncultured Cytophaga sp. TaxID=160238 RepID=UPI00261A78E4|nr:porin [uncultured Cytophaga sp.]